MAIDGPPVGLDDHALFLHETLEPPHHLAALVRIRNRQRVGQQRVEFGIAEPALVPRLPRPMGQGEHLNTQRTLRPVGG